MPEPMFIRSLRHRKAAYEEATRQFNSVETIGHYMTELKWIDKTLEDFEQEMRRMSVTGAFAQVPR